MGSSASRCVEVLGCPARQRLKKCSTASRLLLLVGCTPALCSSTTRYDAGEATSSDNSGLETLPRCAAALRAESRTSLMYVNSSPEPAGPVHFARTQSFAAGAT